MRIVLIAFALIVAGSFCFPDVQGVQEGQLVQIAQKPAKKPAAISAPLDEYAAACKYVRSASGYTAVLSVNKPCDKKYYLKCFQVANHGEMKTGELWLLWADKSGTLLGKRWDASELAKPAAAAPQSCPGGNCGGGMSGGRFGLLRHR